MGCQSVFKQRQLCYNSAYRVAISNTKDSDNFVCITDCKKGTIVRICQVSNRTFSFQSLIITFQRGSLDWIQTDIPILQINSKEGEKVESFYNRKRSSWNFVLILSGSAYVKTRLDNLSFMLVTIHQVWKNPHFLYFANFKNTLIKTIWQFQNSKYREKRFNSKRSEIDFRSQLWQKAQEHQMHTLQQSWCCYKLSPTISQHNTPTIIKYFCYLLQCSK